MTINVKKAPFPWFGGKSKASDAVWRLLGDPAHYVEPFCGSMAVLINRPESHVNRVYFSETVNDKDGLLINAWRGIQMHPEETATHASWPVSEADLHARHCALVAWRESRELEHLMGDPMWCDTRMAGWWLWGISCWIGGHWCHGHNGPWWPDDTGRLGKRRRRGVKRQRPHLGSNGQGVNRPQLREPGIGNPCHPVTMPKLTEWFNYLSARLRHVRIISGDWGRVVTGGAAETLPCRFGGKGHVGIFFDPPYADTAGRADLYTEEDMQVAHHVVDWCLSSKCKPRWRVVLASYDTEHGSRLRDAGWREVEWYSQGFLRGGMGNTSKSGGHQQHRERLWASPSCLAESMQTEFDWS